MLEVFQTPSVDKIILSLEIPLLQDINLKNLQAPWLALSMERPVNDLTVSILAKACSEQEDEAVETA
jgi:hypothetical protein